MLSNAKIGFCGGIVALVAAPLAAASGLLLSVSAVLLSDRWQANKFAGSEAVRR
jgi:hypothetical protein